MSNTQCIDQTGYNL